MTWKRIPLSEIVVLAQNGVSARTGSGEPTVVLRLADVDSEAGVIARDGLRHVGLSPDNREKYTLRRGDLLLIRVNGSPAIAGRAVVYDGPAHFTYCDHFIRVRLAEGANPRFVAYQLGHRPVRAQIEAGMVSTAGQHTISQRTIAAVSLLLPPPDEQDRIVTAIDDHFSRIDASVASLKRAKANVKRARASVLKAAVEGRLVPIEAALAHTEGRDYEPASNLLARILAERRARWAESGAKGKHKEPPLPETEGLGNLPLGWTWATVEQLSTHIVDCLHSTPKFTGSGHVCLDTNAMGPGMIRAEGLRYVDRDTFDERNRRLVPTAGDIVFAREGTVGNAVVLGDLPVCLGQRTMLMRPSSCITPRLMMHWIMSPLVRTQYAPLIAGSTVAHLNMADIRRFALPLPPLAEQHRIIAEVDRRLSVLDALDATLDANLARCAKLRQSILKRAFEGKLVRPDASRPAAPQLPLFTEEAAP